MANEKQLLEQIKPKGFLSLPPEWVTEGLILLQVSSCKHFRYLGIRKDSYVGIDTSAQFINGEPCAFLKYEKGVPNFRLSKKLLKGYECIGRLCLVVSFPVKEV